MKHYTLYSEEGCPDCTALKNNLNQLGITYENRDINEKIPGAQPHKYRWEKNDLVKQRSLPGYVPILHINENNNIKILASGMVFEDKGDVIIFSTIEEALKNL
tara:strand:- start:174 stop:482 length:309 start_codon:yes stop_codon:yes gene_type:complete